METLSRKELHSKVHEYLSTLYSEDLRQLPSPIVIIGNIGIGKTSIVVEEAAKLGSTPIEGELDLQESTPEIIVCNEFEKFYLLSMRFYGVEHFLSARRPALVNFMMTKAMPMHSEPKDQKAVIIEIDCMKDEADVIEKALKPMPVYYYKLTKEDWKEWAETIDPATGLANVPPFIVSAALQGDDFEQ